ncbi:MAG: metallophosphoesterase family protein [Candidatus Wenzhouxiangella sp. M2_3B_020]
MKLLAVGDMHLGRVPASLPEALAEQARGLGPEVAWRRCVEHAVRHEVEAVLLAGDVVDRERDFFAGYDQLRSGIERLLTAEIRVLAVAGNHDTHVLPRLADAVDGLELLGRDGNWETAELSAGSIVGWSFPQRRVTRSPLADWRAPEGRRPHIGLLHCDRDQRDSAYAPVTSEELARTGLDAWLLGHVHQPDLGGDERPSGYLGSVTALRASETGVRGPWLVDTEDGRINVSQVPLAPLAYEPVVVDVGEIERADALDIALLEAGRRAVSERARKDSLPDALGLRVRLTGEHPDSIALRETAQALTEDPPVFDESGCRVFIDRLDCAFGPPLDLEALARRPDPAGLLARDLLLLDGPDTEERRQLVEEARERMNAAGAVTELHAVARTVDDDEAADALQRAGRAALARLMAQRASRES